MESDGDESAMSLGSTDLVEPKDQEQSGVQRED